MLNSGSLRKSMKRDVTATKDRSKVSFKFVVFPFFFGKGTRQPSHLRTDKDLPWDTEKNKSLFSVSQGKMYSSWEMGKALVRVRAEGSTPT